MVSIIHIYPFSCPEFRVELLFPNQREEDGVNTPLEPDSPNAMYNHSHHSQAASAMGGGGIVNNLVEQQTAYVCQTCIRIPVHNCSFDDD